MIRLAISRAHVETLDGKDSEGRSIMIQVGRFLLDLSLTRKR